MPRLPQPGSDNGTWGTILNEYLSQAHKADGTLKDDIITGATIAPSAITAATIQDGTVTEAKLHSDVQTKLNTGNSSITAADITDATVTGRSLLTAANIAAVKTSLSLAKADVGLSNVDNTSDATKNSAAAILTNKTISGESNTLTDIGISSLSATGTASASTYLRGDGLWATPAGGGSLPSQTGNSGRMLVTDGTSASWRNSYTIDITAPPYNAVADGWNATPTDNAAAIQAALDDADGRPVYVPPGVFAVGSSLVMNPGQVLIGCNHIGSAAMSGTGPDPTQVSAICATSGMNEPIILGSDGVGYVNIRDLFIDGVKLNNTGTYGIYLEDGSVGQEAQWVIERVTLNNCAVNGIYIGGNRRNVHGYRANCTGSGQDGLYIKSSDSAFSESVFSGSGQNGVYIAGGSQSRLYACDIFGNLGSGVRLADWQNHVFIMQTSIDRNHMHGIHLGANTWNVAVTNCLFASNSRASNGAYHHIYSQSEAVGGLTLSGNGFTYGGDIAQKPGYVIYLDSIAGSVYEFGDLTQSAANPVVNGWTNAPLRVVKGNTIVCSAAEYETVSSPIPGVVYIVKE